jgi:lipid-binding SYLF domain-containing protein
MPHPISEGPSMKAIACLLLFVFVAPAFAIDKADLDARVAKLAAKFEALQQKPGKAVPAEMLRKAKGIVFLDRTKAGFIFGFQGGSGVAFVRDPETAEWSAPGWVGAGEASFGVQIGGQQTFVVILLMTTNATATLTDSSMEFGGEAGGTASRKSGGIGGTVTSPEEAMLVFSDSKGLYGGATLKGGLIAPDSKANHIYYGRSVTMREILFENKVKATETAAKLSARVTEFSKPPEK